MHRDIFVNLNAFAVSSTIFYSKISSFRDENSSRVFYPEAQLLFCKKKIISKALTYLLVLSVSALAKWISTELHCSRPVLLIPNPGNVVPTNHRRAHVYSLCLCPGCWSTVVASVMLVFLNIPPDTVWLFLKGTYIKNKHELLGTITKN